MWIEDYISYMVVFTTGFMLALLLNVLPAEEKEDIDTHLECKLEKMELESQIIRCHTERFKEWLIVDSLGTAIKLRHR